MSSTSQQHKEALLNAEQRLAITMHSKHLYTPSPQGGSQGSSNKTPSPSGYPQSPGYVRVEAYQALQRQLSWASRTVRERAAKIAFLENRIVMEGQTAEELKAWLAEIKATGGIRTPSEHTPSGAQIIRSPWSESQIDEANWPKSPVEAIRALQAQIAGLRTEIQARDSTDIALQTQSSILAGQNESFLNKITNLEQIIASQAGKITVLKERFNELVTEADNEERSAKTRMQRTQPQRWIGSIEQTTARSQSSSQGPAPERSTDHQELSTIEYVSQATGDERESIRQQLRNPTSESEAIGPYIEPYFNRGSFGTSQTRRKRRPQTGTDVFSLAIDVQDELSCLEADNRWLREQLYAKDQAIERMSRSMQMQGYGDKQIDKLVSSSLHYPTPSLVPTSNCPACQQIILQNQGLQQKITEIQQILLKLEDGVRFNTGQTQEQTTSATNRLWETRSRIIKASDGSDLKWSTIREDNQERILSNIAMQANQLKQETLNTDSSTLPADEPVKETIPAFEQKAIHESLEDSKDQQSISFRCENCVVLQSQLSSLLVNHQKTLKFLQEFNQRAAYAATEQLKEMEGLIDQANEFDNKLQQIQSSFNHVSGTVIPMLEKRPMADDAVIEKLLSDFEKLPIDDQTIDNLKAMHEAIDIPKKDLTLEKVTLQRLFTLISTLASNQSKQQSDMIIDQKQNQTEKPEPPIEYVETCRNTSPTNADTIFSQQKIVVPQRIVTSNGKLGQVDEIQKLKNQIQHLGSEHKLTSQQKNQIQIKMQAILASMRLGTLSPENASRALIGCLAALPQSVKDDESLMQQIRNAVKGLATQLNEKSRRQQESIAQNEPESEIQPAAQEIISAEKHDQAGERPLEDTVGQSHRITKLMEKISFYIKSSIKGSEMENQWQTDIQNMIQQILFMAERQKDDENDLILLQQYAQAKQFQKQPIKDKLSEPANEATQASENKSNDDDKSKYIELQNENQKALRDKDGKITKLMNEAKLQAQLLTKLRQNSLDDQNLFESYIGQLQTVTERARYDEADFEVLHHLFQTTPSQISKQNIIPDSQPEAQATVETQDQADQPLDERYTLLQKKYEGLCKEQNNEQNMNKRRIQRLNDVIKKVQSQNSTQNQELFTQFNVLQSIFNTYEQDVQDIETLLKFTGKNQKQISTKDPIISEQAASVSQDPTGRCDDVDSPQEAKDSDLRRQIELLQQRAQNQENLFQNLYSYIKTLSSSQDLQSDDAASIIEALQQGVQRILQDNEDLMQIVKLLVNFKAHVQSKKIDDLPQQDAIKPTQMAEPDRLSTPPRTEQTGIQSINNEILSKFHQNVTEALTTMKDAFVNCISLDEQQGQLCTELLSQLSTAFNQVVNDFDDIQILTNLVGHQKFSEELLTQVSELSINPQDLQSRDRNRDELFAMLKQEKDALKRVIIRFQANQDQLLQDMAQQDATIMQKEQQLYTLRKQQEELVEILETYQEGLDKGIEQLAQLSKRDQEGQQLLENLVKIFAKSQQYNLFSQTPLTTQEGQSQPLQATGTNEINNRLEQLQLANQGYRGQLIQQAGSNQMIKTILSRIQQRFEESDTEHIPPTSQVLSKIEEVMQCVFQHDSLQTIMSHLMGLLPVKLQQIKDSKKNDQIGQVIESRDLEKLQKMLLEWSDDLPGKHDEIQNVHKHLGSLISRLVADYEGLITISNKIKKQLSNIGTMSTEEKCSQEPQALEAEMEKSEQTASNTGNAGTDSAQPPASQ